MTNNVINKIPKNNNDGFIKADQLIYFDKSKIDYYVLGRIDEELLDKLILLIIALNNKNKIKHNIENIKDNL